MFVIISEVMWPLFGLFKTNRHKIARKYTVFLCMCDAKRPNIWFFRCFLPLFRRFPCQNGGKWEVVGVFKGIVDDCVMTLPDVATEQDVVDAYGKASGVEGDTESVAALDEGAGECACEESMGVGDGRLVEVAAKDHGTWRPPADDVADAVGLSGSIGGSLGEEAYDGRELAPQGVAHET